MAVIQRLARQRPKNQKEKTMATKYTIEERDGRRVYTRREESGALRALPVWGAASCLKKIQESKDVKKMFEQMEVNRAQYNQEPGDAMYRDWFNECMAIMETAYDFHTSEAREPAGESLEAEPGDFGVVVEFEVEDFGAEPVEEFGETLEIFGA